MVAVFAVAPAGALGENGPFDLPLAHPKISLAPDAVTRIPLSALLTDKAEPELEQRTARLVLPPDATPEQTARIKVADDGRSADVIGQGTWSLLGNALVFTPLGGRVDPPLPIGLTMQSVHGTTSRAARIDVGMLKLQEMDARVSAGARARLDLPAPAGEGHRMRLQLDGQEAGSTLTSDGSTMVVAEQGTWRVADHGKAITYAPVNVRPEMQPDSVRYVVEDADGLVIGSGRARVTVPIIADIYRSAPFGEPITLAVGQAQQNVASSTLRLRAPQGEEDVRVSEDGLEAVVPDQGVWRVDRANASVTFTPQSAKVRVAAPMLVLGGDGKGAKAAPALLSTAYPILVDRVGVAVPGDPVVLDLSDGALDVRPESFAFEPTGLPAGATLSHDRTTATIPGQGTWSIDREARTATFTAEGQKTGVVSTIAVTARGVYADNPVSATFSARFTKVLPTMRDDEMRTAPGERVTLDPLANDTAGSAARPLNAATLRIRALSATNLSQLEQGLGRRLVMPGEGVYTVDDSGAVTFVPADGFVGQTTPIEYVVEDSDGVPVTATIGADVDPGLTRGSAQRSQPATGVSALLMGIIPGTPATALMFDAIVALLLFSGAISLWIGSRMEADRRTWDD